MSNVQKALARVNDLYPEFLFSEKHRQEKFEWWLQRYLFSDQFEKWLNKMCEIAR